MLKCKIINMAILAWQELTMLNKECESARCYLVT